MQKSSYGKNITDISTVLKRLAAESLRSEIEIANKSNVKKSESEKSDIG